MAGDQITAVPAVYAIETENNQRNNCEVDKRKLKRNKCFVLMVILVVILFAALFSCLFVLYRYIFPKSNRHQNDNICVSDECVRMAAVFKRTMDTSVDPCDNFAQYACGKWTENFLKPDSVPAYSWLYHMYIQQGMKLRDLFQKNLTNIYGADLPRAVLEAQNLYYSCIDTETIDKNGLNPLLSVLKKLNLSGTPPALMDNYEPTDLIKKAAQVKRLFNLDVFFKVEVYVDLRNITTNLIVIGSPTPNNPLDTFFISKDDKKMEQFFKIKRKNENNKFNESDIENLEKIFMKDVLKEMISNISYNIKSCRKNSPEEDEKIDSLVEKILSLKTLLYKEGNNTSNIEDFDYDYNELPEEELMYVDSLQKLTDEFLMTVNDSLQRQEIWAPFIGELFKDVLKPNWRTRYKLWVYDLEHLKKFALLFAIVDKKLLETITWWTVVQALTPYSSTGLRTAWQDYMMNFLDLETINSRSISCVYVVNNLMGMASSWLYFDQSFHDEDHGDILKMMKYMKSAFSNLILNSDWLDKSTKMAILKKNSNPIAAIGYPKWLFKKKKLDLYYSDVNLSEEYLNNILQILEKRNLGELKTLDLHNDRNVEYWVDPIIINAFHLYIYNQIIVPMGILQFPIFSSSLWSINYGMLGASVLGHELSHGFDNLGRRFNTEGNLKPWWSNKSISEYISRVKCYINHYNHYYIEETDTYVNGKTTLNENIADVLGVKQAFLGYQRWKEMHGEEPKLPGFTNFTHEQLLFLSYAMTWCQTTTPILAQLDIYDSHSPNDVRILGVLRNSDEFSEAWQCPVGSYMNPKEKCTLW